MALERGLGKGLDSLFRSTRDAEQQPERDIKKLALTQLVPGLISRASILRNPVFPSFPFQFVIRGLFSRLLSVQRQTVFLRCMKLSPVKGAGGLQNLPV